MADMNITVGLDDRASRKLREIDRAAKSLSGTLRTAGAAVAAFATGSIAAGITNQYRQFERYRTVLTTFLGSQQKANAELRRLQDLANSLPQDLSDVTEAFTIFSRFGLDTSAEALTAWSNVATANAKSLSQLGEAVADALTGEFERLKEFGIKVSKENNKFVARIGNDQVALASSTQDLVNQLEELGNTRFGGAATANADTLNQSFSNLQGSIFTTSVTIMEELRPALKEALDLTANWLNTHQELVKALSGRLGEGLTASIHASARALTVLADNIEVVKNAAIAYLSLRFANAFVNLATKMSSAVKAGQTLSGMLTTMGKVAAGTARGIPILGTAISSLGTVAARLGPLLLNPFIGIPVAIATAVGSGLYFFRDKMIDLGSTSASVGEILAATWWGLTEVFQGTAQYLKDTFTSAFDSIRGSVRKIYNDFGENFQKVSEVIKNVMNIGIGLVWGFFETIWNNLRNLPSFFLQAFNSSLKVIGEFVTRGGAYIAELWDYIKTFGEDEITNTFDGLGTLIGEEVAKIGSTIDPINWTEVLGVDYIGNASSYVAERVATLVTTISEPLKDATGNLVEGYRASLAEAEAAAAATRNYDDAILRIARSQTLATEATNTATAAAATNASTIETIASTYKRATDAIKEFYTNQTNVNGAMLLLESDFNTGKISLDDFRRGMEAVGGTIDNVADRSIKFGLTLTESIGSALTGLSSSISGTLTDVLLGLKGGFEGLQDIALSVVKAIVNSLIQNFLISPLLNNINTALSAAFAPKMGGFGGGGFSLFGMIGSLFGLPFFDGGGYTGVGSRAGGVDGKGGFPAILHPNETVVDHSKGQSLGGGDAPVVNISINAIDTQTGTEFLVKNKQIIVGAVQEAYNRKGRAGPLG